ncbi:transposase [Salisediminibacterium selenitireducens]|uniref:Transposase IS3/IS911 family protein n=1 Tax=Bacillus selenitireducens (strain ATCC 700615 / DSM 15326 / MLS10) TaxID=439292 RepID=D6XZM6_BACIE|nr:transposase [Salisediminibacterium selenitireducens]ADH98400.1 transposase IS3/IS911 family protein [[Bacillus] selenitireducens MLS10]
MRKKSNYSLQDKKTAIKQVLKEGESVISVSQKMGIHRDTLYRWIKRYKAGGATELIDKRITSDLAIEPSQSDIKEVQKEIEQLKKELIALKKSPVRSIE